MPPIYKLTIHQWAVNHDLSIMSATMSHKAVMMADMMWEGSMRLRSGQVDEKLPARPSAAEWLPLYENRTLVLKSSIDAVPDFGVSGNDALRSLVLARKIQRGMKEDPEGARKRDRYGFE